MAAPSGQEPDQRLEEKISFLERHIEQQDREIYAQSERLEQLARELKALKSKVESLDEGTSLPPDEKPPHY